MKAYVLKGIKELEYTEVADPVLAEGRVLVKVHAAGICGSDIPRIYENGTYHFPTIPGHEFAGEVCKVYTKEQEHWLGKRVGVFPLIPCGKCPACKMKAYEMCTSYDYLGSRSDGGFAELVSVPEWNLIELPENMSYEAAAMLEPAAVGIHALRQLDWIREGVNEIKATESVVVYGPGTIGLLMAQWLRYLGMKRVILVGTRRQQQELAAELGFQDFINSKETNATEMVMKLTDGEGASLTVECTGYGDVLCNCLNTTQRGGDILAVGNPHSNVMIDRDTYWKLLRKQLKIHGTWNSSFIPECDMDDWRMTIKAMEEGGLQPQKQITHRLDFKELEKGLEIMRDKKEFYNKIIIVSCLME